MEKIIKYIFIIIGTIVLEWIFLAFACTIFSSSFEGAAIIGTAFFLAAEIIICTGVIISKFENK